MRDYVDYASTKIKLGSSSLQPKKLLVISKARYNYSKWVLNYIIIYRYQVIRVNLVNLTIIINVNGVIIHTQFRYDQINDLKI